MKKLIVVLLLLCFNSLFGQQTILLNDGSSLNGAIVSMDSVLAQTVIRLQDGTEISLPSNLVVSAIQSRKTYFVFENGSKFLQKGWYTQFAFQMLTAKTESDFLRSKRWDVGAHVSTGYQFGQFIALGAGAGIDGMDVLLLQIFFETLWSLTNTKDFDMKNRGGLGYRIPLTYALQLGYNFPVEYFFSDDEVLKTTGGILVYPSLGLTFPTRSGASLQFDVGYKIQRIDREYFNWWGVSTNEAVTMRSFAMRAGVVF